MDKTWLKYLKTRLLQQHCTFCDTKTGDTEIPVCQQCFAELPWCKSTGSTLNERAAFYYEEPVSQYILAGKTGRQLEKLHILGQLFCHHAQENQHTLPQALLPVPLHTKRLQERGFNQSIELARPVSRQFNIPILTDSIVRKRDTGEQKGLTEAQRKHNMENAFSVKKEIPYQHIAIFDDVITTGTTCTTLRSLLLEQGIKKVEIWCCATTKQ